MKTKLEKWFTILFLGITISIYSQVTATFSADNAYAVYKGDANGITQKLMPVGNSNGIINTSLSEILQPESRTFNLASNDWLYIIAWADEAVCQGLIGEFTGDRSIKTGDPRIQVYPTFKENPLTNTYVNNEINTHPTFTEINQYINLANSTNGWRVPFTGPTNQARSTACTAYLTTIAGIAPDAKWIWNNPNGVTNPNHVFTGNNRIFGDYLIFRIPMETILDSPEDPVVSPCDSLDIRTVSEIQTVNNVKCFNPTNIIFNIEGVQTSGANYTLVKTDDANSTILNGHLNQSNPQITFGNLIPGNYKLTVSSGACSRAIEFTVCAAQPCTCNDLTGAILSDTNSLERSSGNKTRLDCGGTINYDLNSTKFLIPTFKECRISSSLGTLTSVRRNINYRIQMPDGSFRTGTLNVDPFNGGGLKLSRSLFPICGNYAVTFETKCCNNDCTAKCEYKINVTGCSTPTDTGNTNCTDCCLPNAFRSNETLLAQFNPRTTLNYAPNTVFINAVRAYIENVNAQNQLANCSSSVTSATLTQYRYNGSISVCDLSVNQLRTLFTTNRNQFVQVESVSALSSHNFTTGPHAYIVELKIGNAANCTATSIVGHIGITCRTTGKDDKNTLNKAGYSK